MENYKKYLKYKKKYIEKKYKKHMGGNGELNFIDLLHDSMRFNFEEEKIFHKQESIPNIPLKGTIFESFIKYYTDNDGQNILNHSLRNYSSGSYTNIAKAIIYTFFNEEITVDKEKNKKIKMSQLIHDGQDNTRDQIMKIYSIYGEIRNIIERMPEIARIHLEITKYVKDNNTKYVEDNTQYVKDNTHVKDLDLTQLGFISVIIVIIIGFIYITINSKTKRPIILFRGMKFDSENDFDSKLVVEYGSSSNSNQNHYGYFKDGGFMSMTYNYKKAIEFSYAQDKLYSYFCIIRVNPNTRVLKLNESNVFEKDTPPENFEDDLKSYYMLYYSPLCECEILGLPSCYLHVKRTEKFICKYNFNESNREYKIQHLKKYTPDLKLDTDERYLTILDCEYIPHTMGCGDDNIYCNSEKEDEELFKYYIDRLIPDDKDLKEDIYGKEKKNTQTNEKNNTKKTTMWDFFENKFEEKKK